MNAQEIKSLIDLGIKGQGTSVDGGGVLATVLEALVDAVEESKPVVIEIEDTGLTTEPISTFFENMKIDGEYATEEKLLSLSLEKGPIICKCGHYEILTVNYYYAYSEDDERVIEFIAGGRDDNAGVTYSLRIDFNRETTSALYYEV